MQNNTMELKTFMELLKSKFDLLEKGEFEKATLFIRTKYIDYIALGKIKEVEQKKYGEYDGLDFDYFSIYNDTIKELKYAQANKYFKDSFVFILKDDTKIEIHFH